MNQWDFFSYEYSMGVCDILRKKDFFCWECFFFYVPIFQTTLSWLESNIFWQDRKDGGRKLQYLWEMLTGMKQSMSKWKEAALGYSVKLNKLKFAYNMLEMKDIVGLLIDLEMTRLLSVKHARIWMEVGTLEASVLKLVKRRRTY